MEKLVIGLLIAASVTAGATSAIQPDLSVSCKASKQKVSEFNFDLYPTGHPMAGVGMYSGMFEAKGEGLGCSQLYGSIRVLSRDADGLAFSASASCTSKVEFVLVVPTGSIEPNRTYVSTLKYKVDSDIPRLGPSEPEPFEMQKITCKMVRP